MKPYLFSLLFSYCWLAAMIFAYLFISLSSFCCFSSFCWQQSYCPFFISGLIFYDMGLGSFFYFSDSSLSNWFASPFICISSLYYCNNYFSILSIYILCLSYSYFSNRYLYYLYLSSLSYSNLYFSNLLRSNSSFYILSFSSLSSYYFLRLSSNYLYILSLSCSILISSSFLIIIWLYIFTSTNPNLRLNLPSALSKCFLNFLSLAFLNSSLLFLSYYSFFSFST